MDDLLELLLDIFIGIFADSPSAEKLFLNCSLYPFFPKKERSEEMDGFLRFVGYIPAFIALLAMLSPIFYIIVSLDLDFSRNTLIGCCIAAAIGLLYIIAVVVSNLIINRK